MRKSHKNSKRKLDKARTKKRGKQQTQWTNLKIKIEKKKRRAISIYIKKQSCELSTSKGRESDYKRAKR